MTHNQASSPYLPSGSGHPNTSMDAFNTRTEYGMRNEQINMGHPSDNNKENYPNSTARVLSQDAIVTPISFVETVPEAKSYKYQNDSPSKKPVISRAIRYGFIVITVGGAFATPIIIHRNCRNLDGADKSIRTGEYGNLIFLVFLWLEITWVAAVATDMLALAFPHVFRFAMRYINPAYQRYWRIFRRLRRPATALSTIAVMFISYGLLIDLNDYVNERGPSPGTFRTWNDAVTDFLQQMLFWAVSYFFEKMLILYISVHYQTRLNHKRIMQSKDMQHALITLYDASMNVYPTNSRDFVREDAILRHHRAAANAESHSDAKNLIQKLGIERKEAGYFFNNFSFSESSHWLRPTSSYAVIERALSDPKSAAALAKRIWLSLVLRGNNGLTAEDVAEVLGPYLREKAHHCFHVIDKNESGDIRLDEMIYIVVEAGKVRSAIYQSMADMNHCINTFDWILLIMITGIMVVSILISYVPVINKIKDFIGFAALGAGFAMGYTLQKYFFSCIFVFFLHPFDIGDRVNIFNPTSNSCVSAIVTRQSLLYTEFVRVDNHTEIQITNVHLSQGGNENVSRSIANRECRSIFVDWNTPFTSILALQAELEKFLAAKENSRDFLPELSLNMVSLHELNKIELQCVIMHKSNWSNESVRMARSSKFLCALLAAARSIPVVGPGGKVAQIPPMGRTKGNETGAGQERTTEGKEAAYLRTPKADRAIVEAESVAQEVFQKSEVLRREEHSFAGCEVVDPITRDRETGFRVKRSRESALYP